MTRSDDSRMERVSSSLVRVRVGVKVRVRVGVKVRVRVRVATQLDSGVA